MMVEMVNMQDIIIQIRNGSLFWRIEGKVFSLPKKDMVKRTIKRVQNENFISIVTDFGHEENISLLDLLVKSFLKLDEDENDNQTTPLFHIFVHFDKRKIKKKKLAKSFPLIEALIYKSEKDIASDVEGVLRKLQKKELEIINLDEQLISELNFVKNHIQPAIIHPFSKTRKIIKNHQLVKLEHLKLIEGEEIVPKKVLLDYFPQREEEKRISLGKDYIKRIINQHINSLISRRNTIIEDIRHDDIDIGHCPLPNPDVYCSIRTALDIQSSLTFVRSGCKDSDVCHGLCLPYLTNFNENKNVKVIFSFGSDNILSHIEEFNSDILMGERGFVASFSKERHRGMYGEEYIKLLFPRAYKSFFNQNDVKGSPKTIYYEILKKYISPYSFLLRDKTHLFNGQEFGLNGEHDVERKGSLFYLFLGSENENKNINYSEMLSSSESYSMSISKIFRTKKQHASAQKS